jgi:hypothetical protein
MTSRMVSVLVVVGVLAAFPVNARPPESPTRVPTPAEATAQFRCRQTVLADAQARLEALRRTVRTGPHTQAVMDVFQASFVAAQRDYLAAQRRCAEAAQPGGGHP